MKLRLLARVVAALLPAGLMGLALVAVVVLSAPSSATSSLSPLSQALPTATPHPLSALLPASEPTTEPPENKCPASTAGVVSCCCDAEDPVILHSGEFVLQPLDWSIPGRGLDFEFRRTYRNQSERNGPLGYNWDFNFNRRLEREAPNVLVLYDGFGRRLRYVQQSDGTYTILYFGYYSRLIPHADGSFMLRGPNGQEATYLPLDGTPTAGRLERLRDANGNAIVLHYGANGQLTHLVDTLQRVVTLTYDGAGRLMEVRDASGRQLLFGYDDQGDLTSFTQTAVGLPSEQARTTHYAYGAGQPYARLDHNLVRISGPLTAPDIAEHTIAYGDDLQSLDFDRVVMERRRQTAPGDIEATTTYAYETLPTAPGPHEMLSPQRAAVRTTVTDPRGVVTIYELNQAGGLLRQVEGDAGAGQRVAIYTSNADGEVTSIVFPNGNRVAATYDEGNPDRVQRGNRLRFQEIAADGSLTLATEQQYEGLFNRVISETNPAGDVTRFEYDERGNNTAVTDTLGFVTTSVVDQNGVPLSRSDANGNSTTFEVYYLAPPTPAFVITPTWGPTTSLFYFDAALTSDLEDRSEAILVRWDWEDDGHFDTALTTNKTAQHHYDHSGPHTVRLEVRDSDQLTATLTGEIEFYILHFPSSTAQEMPSGPVSAFLPWAPRGQAPTGASAALTSISPPLVFDGLRAVSSAPLRRIVTTTDALGNITLAVYDAYDNLLRQRDANGHVTSYDYDTFDQLVRITDAAGGVSEFDYDAAGHRTRAVDANGHTTTTAYDLFGRPLTVTDALGFTHTFSYDLDGNLLTETDPLGATTTYTYDAFDQLIARRDALGHVTHFAYDGNGNRTAQTDALGRTATYSYDSLDRLVAVTDAANGVTRYGLDALGNTIIMTDAAGVVTMRVYDARSRLLTETAAAGSLDLTTHYIYDPHGNLLTITDPAGVKICYAYDALHRRSVETRDCGGLDLTTHYYFDPVGNLLRTISPANVTLAVSYDALDRMILARQDDGGLNLTHRYTYDAVGNLASVQDPQGVLTAYAFDAADRRIGQRVDAQPGGLNLTTHWQFDAAGRLIATTDPAGGVSMLTRDALGQITHSADALGQTTTFAYDAAGNRISETNPNGQTTRFEYDALDRLTRLTNALGHSLSDQYDALGRLIASVDPNGQMTRFEYDDAGRLLREINPLGHATVHQYDLAGRRLLTSNPLGQVWRYAYDALGRLTRETNPLGEATSFDYDAAGNLTTVTNAIPPGGTPADGRTTTYHYDAANRLRQEINPLGHAVSYAYDAASNRIGLTDANQHTTHFAYDAARRLLSSADPLGRVTTYAYDPVGRVTRLQRANGDVTDYTYDAAGRQIAVHYADGSHIERVFDAAGLLTQVVGPQTDVNLTYDAAGRMTHIADHRLQKATSYDYDAAGNRLRLTGPDGLVLTYAYDAAGQLAQVTHGGQQHTFAYDAAGQMTGHTLPNQASVVYAYDAAGRTRTVEFYGPAGALTDRLAYTFDAAGQRTRIETLGGDRTVYAYDDAGQLTSEQRSGTVNYDQSFSYDAAGNRTRWVSDTLTTQFSFDAANQLIHQQSGAVTTNFSYDANGNLILRQGGGAALTYAYTPAGLLHSISGAGVQTTYDYDAFDRRVAQAVNGSEREAPVVTTFLFDDVQLGATVLAEYDAQGAQQAHYTLAPVTDGRLARTAQGATAYYLRDALGSTHAMMAADGAWLNRYLYDGFGQAAAVSETIANPYRFSGQPWDETAGHYQFRARSYDPALGRFLQPDPLGAIDASNLYLYALNDPVNRIDPLGWTSEECDTIAYESPNNLGLLKWANRLSVFLKFLPNAPEVEWSGKWNVTGKLCRKCCESGPHKGEWRKAGEISIGASATMEVKWPVGALRLSFWGYTFKFGLEAFVKFELSVSGGGAIDFCADQVSVKVCGGGSVTGGLRGGLLEWPFQKVSVVAYIYGQISGQCQTCVEYAFGAGFSMSDTKCNVCGKVGYYVEVKWWRFSYSHEGIWAQGCL